MAGNYDGLARMLILNVGSKENIESISHTKTQLCFVLKDEGQANTGLIQALDGVSSVGKTDGQYRIGVGSQAADVYECVLRVGHMEELGQSGNLDQGNSSNGAKVWLISLILAVIVGLGAIFGLDVTVVMGVVIGAAAGAVCAFVGLKVMGSKAGEKEEDEALNVTAVLEMEKLASPVTGKAIALDALDDEAFSSGKIGNGMGFEPEEGKLYAPCDGEISTFFPTGHAIGIHSDGGADVLIHVGKDTVKLNGKGFTPMKHQGEHTKKGELLLEFDLNAIKKAGYVTQTPMIVSNSADYSQIKFVGGEDVSVGDEVVELVP